MIHIDVFTPDSRRAAVIVMLGSWPEGRKSILPIANDNWRRLPHGGPIS